LERTGLLVEEWIDDALCKEIGGDIFFPTTEHDTAKEAKQVCAMCPVSLECLAYALTFSAVDGVWGGTTERERRRMKRGKR
jgi:WhiB family redox-sensing transcriptional regulator